MIRQIEVLLDRRQRKQITLVMAGICVAAGLEMLGIGAIPAFVAALADPDRLLRAIPEGELHSWIAGADRRIVALNGALVLAVIFLLKNSFIAVLIYVEARLVRDVTATTAERMFRTYLYKPYTFHLQKNPAELMRNVSTEVLQATGLVSNGMLLMREGLVLVVVFLLLLLLDPLISLLAFLMLGSTSTLFYFSVRKSLEQRGTLAQEHRARILRAARQGLGAIKDAKILGREPYLVDAFSREVRGVQSHGLYQRMVAALPRLFLEVLGVSAIVIVAATFVLLDRTIESMLPVLAMLAVGIARLLPAFNSISSSLAQLRYQRPALELVSNELGLVESNAASSDALVEPGTHVFSREIFLDNVDYQYPHTSRMALQGISLTIRAGESVGFVGPSGGGKSTLIDLMLGLLLPTSGHILVDGRDMQQWRRSWQRQVGYVPQDIYLTDDSIRRNVAFGLSDDEIDDKALQRALKAARLDALVAELDDGVETVIGDRGIRLSGGQKQRLGIARALYHNPRVLVLDEATSALDEETEREVATAIGKLRRDHTILIIAHRVSTVQACDRLYLIEDGKVKDEGTPKSLTARHAHLGEREAVSTEGSCPQ